jgi:hypothetical protein
MYVLHNIEARSCNYFYRGKVTRITYTECVFVTLGIQYAKQMLDTNPQSLLSSGLRPAPENAHSLF